jgi:hypothetical protein
METIYLMKNSDHKNPYHLFFYMLSYLKRFDSGIHYYYPECDNQMVESALNNLPKRFVREFVVRDNCKYLETTIKLIERIEPADEGWIFQYIRSLYEHIWSQYKQIKGKYTYISRKKAAVRRIVNEDAYLDDLKQLGVSVYFMEDMSFLDQIKLFAESEIVTGPHGAAFSFAIFCKPQTLLYEIYRSDDIKAHYTILANECNLRYKRFHHLTDFNELSHDMTIDKESYIDSLNELIAFSRFSEM